jgi:hypothetical protein
MVAYTVAGWGEGILIQRQPAWFPILTVVALLLVTLLHSWLRHVGTALLAITLVLVTLRSPVKPADLFISEDGRLVGFWSNGQDQPDARILATNRSRPPAFLLDQWQPALALSQNLPPNQLQTPVLPSPADWKSGESWDQPTSQQARQIIEGLVEVARTDAFTCIRGACSAMVSGGWRVVTLDRADLAGIACDVADIVIVAARSRMKDCRTGARFISETTLRATGAMELRLGEPDEKEIDTTPAFTGPPRPWTIHRLYDWRTGLTGSQHPVSDDAVTKNRAQEALEPLSERAVGYQ